MSWKSKLISFIYCREKAKAAGFDFLPPVKTINVRQLTFAIILFTGAAEHNVINVDVAAVGVISGRKSNLK